jgi:hypothetical protein
MDKIRKKISLLPQAWLNRGSRRIGLTSGIQPAAASPDNQTFLYKDFIQAFWG